MSLLGNLVDQSNNNTVGVNNHGRLKENLAKPILEYDKECKKQIKLLKNRIKDRSNYTPVGGLFANLNNNLQQDLDRDGPTC